MDELVNIITENGELTNKSISKIDAHKNGTCHGISAIAIINDKGELLIQKRSSTKKDEPNMWDLSTAGHIDIDETPKQAAIRELYEELNIKIEEKELIFIDTYLNKIKLDKDNYINHFTYLFIIRKNIKIENIIMQKSEVSKVMFVNKEKYMEMVNAGYMVNAIKYSNKVLKYIK